MYPRFRGQIGFLARWSFCACVLFTAAGLLWAQTDKLAAKSQRAKQAMSAGRFKEAVALYQELVRAVPGNPGLLMNLGLALHSAGEYRKAIEQFETVLKKQPKLAPAWLLLGLAHLKLNEPARAVEPLQRVLEADPRDKIARLELADAFLALGRPEEAAANFQKLAELDPSHPKAWQGLGLSYVSLSRRCFEEVEKTAPESAYWYALLARSRAEQQQYRSAFYFYRKALAEAPSLRGAHAALAEIYRKTGHADWAAVEEDRERQLAPPDCSSGSLECGFLSGRYRELVAAAERMKTPPSLYWQARAYGELALEAFGRLSQLPPAAEIYELMAVAYRLEGLHHNSVKEWREALKLTSPGVGDFCRLQKELARSLWLSRDYQAAQPLLEELLKREPESAELNYLLGDTLVELRETAKAIPHLEEAVKSSPNLLPARASLARAYLRAGLANKAIPHFEAALTTDQDGSLLYQLARAYEQAGQDALAKQTMRKFEEISESTQAQRRKLTEDFQITPP